jgi:hypothetical protein
MTLVKPLVDLLYGVRKGLGFQHLLGAFFVANVLADSAINVYDEDFCHFISEKTKLYLV